MECWGAGSLCTRFGGGNLGMEFFPSNRRGTSLNEVVYGHECFDKSVVFWLLLLVAKPNQKQQQEYLV